jgi:hypothetical protein
MRFASVRTTGPFSLALGLAALGSGALSSVSQAKTFTNSYVSFELPEKWDCQLEQTEWVCRPTAAQEQQQAIIILTAKEVGPSDSVPSYLSHLKTPRQITSRTGALLMSEILTVDSKKIADQPWVDGFHKSSEVPNYLTRYLATTKGKIAVLITFSAHQLYYSKYSQDFLRAIGSLRVIAPKDLGKGGGNGGIAGDGPFGLPEEQPGQGGGGGAMGTKTRSVLALALVLAAIGAYMLIKKSKKKR